MNENELPREIDLYVGFMEEIKVRAGAIDRYLSYVSKSGSAVDAFADAESCVLQVRYICELIALSSAAVHHLIAPPTKELLASYKPGLTFKLLEESNAHPFPRALQYGGRPGHYEFKPDTMDLAELQKVYGICGDLLHRGAVKHVLSGRERAYSPDDILGWTNRIKALLHLHAVLMLDVGKVVLVTMYNEQGVVEIKIAASDGPAVLIENEPPPALTAV